MKRQTRQIFCESRKLYRHAAAGGAAAEAPEEEVEEIIKGFQGVKNISNE